MNRSEIRTRILERLNESPTSPVLFSTAQIDELIDEAGEILAEEAAAIKRTAFVPLRAGTTYYYTRGIAQDMMAPYRLWLTHLDRRLTAVSISELDEQNERWVDVKENPEYWFSLSWDLFGIYPHPAAGGGVLRVDYLAWPRALLSDSDTPEFPEPDQDGMVLYGVYDGLVKMWDADKALVVFSAFIEKVIAAQARSGVARMDARTFRPPTQPGVGFRSGVSR